MKTLILAAIILAHGDGRWCPDYYCDMCNRNHLRVGHSVDTTGMGSQQLIDHHEALHAIVIDSTPMEVVRRMLEIVQPTKKDILYDLGCGDGRVLIEARRVFGCYVHGIEIRPEVAELARRRMVQAGLIQKIYTGDATKYILNKATIVTMYLGDELMGELVPKLGACKIVSYNHKIPGYKNKEYKIGTGTIYFVDLTWKKYVTID